MLLINKIVFLLLSLCLVTQGAAAQEMTVTKNAPAMGDEAASLPRMTIGRGFTGSYLASQFAKSSGDIEGAIRYLRRAHKNTPDNDDIVAQLQGLLLLDGKIDEAIALIKDDHDVYSQDSVSALLTVLHDIKRGDMAKANNVLNTIFEANNDQLWMPLIAAWLDVSQNKLTKPLSIEELSVTVGRTAPIVHYHLALINTRAGFPKAAAENYKQAIEDVQNPPTRIMSSLLRFYEQNGSPEILTPLINEYYAAHPEGVSEKDAPKIALPQDGVAEVLYTMGSIMLGAGLTQDATIYLQLAIYLKPDFPAAVFALGDAYSDLQQYARANKIYDKVSSQNSSYVASRLRIAINYDRMGKTGEAIALLDTLARQSPKQYEALVAKGDLMRIHARFPEAIEAYTQAIKRLPELQPLHWGVLFARGSCYERQGKWNEAEADLRQALVLKPDQPDVLNYLGFSLLTRGEKLEEARDMVEKAVQARPNDPQIIDSMGWALYLLADYDSAVGYLEKAVGLLPGDPTINDHLGDAYWRQGRKTEARFQWERSLSFSPEKSMVDAIHKKLKEGLPMPIDNVAADVSAISIARGQQTNKDATTE